VKFSLAPYKGMWVSGGIDPITINLKVISNSYVVKSCNVSCLDKSVHYGSLCRVSTNIITAFSS
jgi:hypothetical protein